MLDCGLDAVLCMRFRKQDFMATASDFLDAVRAQVRLEELWLGALQLLGPGVRGSRAAVAEYAALHGMRLTILPPPLPANRDWRLHSKSTRLDWVGTLRYESGLLHSQQERALSVSEELQGAGICY
jgi:hypothetical protein